MQNNPREGYKTMNVENCDIEIIKLDTNNEEIAAEK